jgi:glycosyltransferase involved in cell wall biosynthesis
MPKAPRIRVLFVNDTARNGGPGRSLHQLLASLDPDLIERGVVLPRPGVISELLTGEGTGRRVVDELHFARHLVENPVEPLGRAMTRADFEAPLPLRGARLVGNLARGAFAVLELADLVRRGRYDLVYCNGTSANLWGAAAARLARVPAIWHARYTSLPHAVRGLHDRLAASSGVARILCVSRASAELFPRVREKVRIVHNGLDLEDPGLRSVPPRLRAELHLDPGIVVFGSHGRILRRKGYGEMIRAARLALDRVTLAEGERMAFVVLGDTPEDFRFDHLSECRALVRELGLGARFFFMGFVPDVRPYVADFDVAIVPSVYDDPLPRAVLESMALGKAVVAFDVGGVSEMLEDGETGTLLRGRPPDVEGLADAMVRYARAPELRRRHGEGGRVRIARDFDGRRLAKRVEDEIVSTARAKS